MSAQVVKKVSAPYLLFATNNEPTLFTIGKASTMNAVLTVNGNLSVMGTTTTINSSVTDIADNIITLNSGIAPTEAPSINAGIEVDRGSSPTVGVIWNETTDRWQISNDGVTYNNIATTGAGGNYISDVVEDLSPQLGGDLDTNSRSITSVGNLNVVIEPARNLQINGVMQLSEVAAIPSTSINNFGLIYAGPVKGGGTGLYVTHSTQTNQELISKKKALLYSLIF